MSKVKGEARAEYRREDLVKVCGKNTSSEYSNGMPPTIVRDGQFRLFFFSREETRIHVHVAHADGEAKFWLTPQVALADHTGLSAAQLRQAQAVVNAHVKEIQDAWNNHFGG